MKKLFKNGTVVNVFTNTTDKTNVLVEDGIIIGVGDYTEYDADDVIDCEGKYLCPGFIDGHIHIESTLLTPFEFCKVSLAHGTTAVICDPHEIANVVGTIGIDYMLKASEGLPEDFFFMVPSCVPSTGFDESFETINAENTKPYFEKKRVLGLAEMMNYVGVVNKDPDILKRIHMAKEKGKHTDGHAPLITGKVLDQYLSAGIKTEHECSSLSEAQEKISKGMWILIREGTAAKNLAELSPLIKSPSSYRCLLCTDDREARDLIHNGEVDNIINKLPSLKISPIDGIRLATINAASCFGLTDRGAIAPGFLADINVLDSLEPLVVKDVYKNGKLVSKDGKALPFEKPEMDKAILRIVHNSMNAKPVRLGDFRINPPENICKVNVINLVPGQLITEKSVETLDFTVNNGIDTERDILKIAVIERHNRTGHIGLGFVKGMGLKSGAIASTVSHDSHNIIVIGTSDEDMFLAAQRLLEIGGGRTIVRNGFVLSEMALEIGGIMTDKPIDEVIKESQELSQATKIIGINKGIAPFMHMSFISLPVIPKIKLTTFGLFDVENFSPMNLFAES